MRGTLHILAAIALLPYVVLALAFVLPERAIAGGSMVAFLEALLRQASWLVAWGVLGFVILFGQLAALGLSARSRWLGGLLLCFIAAVSLAIVILKPDAPIDAEELLLLLPCAAVPVCGSWIAIDARRVEHT